MPQLLGLRSYGNKLGVEFPSDNTPITKEFMDKYFTKDIENAGMLPCWKIYITPYNNRELTIAQWCKDHPTDENEPQPWQVWIDKFDFCRIFYVEQLLALLYGMNLKSICKL